MANKHGVFEHDPGGYYLEEANGWFSVILPKEKINILKNPDFVAYNNNYQHFGGAVLSQGASGILTPASCKVSGTNINSSGIRSIDTYALSAGSYCFSAYVRSQGAKSTIKLQLNTANHDTVVIGDTYERVSMFATFTSKTTVQPAIFCDSPIETIGWQLEVGELTTYISGNNTLHNSWLGPANNSSSYRPITDHTGGEDIALLEYGFRVTEIEGFGPPDFEPIIQNIALSNTDIFVGNTPDAREVVITGQLSGDTFADLMNKHGLLVKLFTNAPARLLFHPFICDESNKCVELDFIYTTGLNETIDRLHLVELSIEGTTTSPCIYSCDNKYAFTQVSTHDYIFDEDKYHIILKNGTVVPTTITPFGRCKITAVASRNNSTYVIANESGVTPYTSTIYRLNMGDLTWTLLGGLTSGKFNDIEIVEHLVVAGGEFEWEAFVPVVGTKSTERADSLVTYNTSTNIWNERATTEQLFAVGTYNNGSAPGIVRAITYNPFDRSIHIGGHFTSVNYNSTQKNYIARYIYNTGKQYADPLIYANLGPVSGGVYAIACDEDNGNVYIGGDFIGDNGPDSLGYTPSFQHDVPNIFCYYDQTIKNYRHTPFPFTYYFGTPFSARISRLTVYNGYVIANGTMNMATNAYNNPPSSPGDSFYPRDYLAAIAWFDPTGNVESSLQSTQRAGGWFPLGASLPTSNNLAIDNNYETVAHGLFRTTNNYLGVQPPLDRLDDYDTRNSLLTFGTQDNSLVIGAVGLTAYGASNNKKQAYGFAEFLCTKNGTPAGGVFVPPSIYNISPTLIYSGQYFNISSPVATGIVANLSVLGFDETLYINTGITIDSCGLLPPEDVTLFIEGGMTLSGVVNITTNKMMIFEKAIIPTALAKLYYRENKIHIVSGDNMYSPEILFSTGNPLNLVPGENRLKLLFDLPKNTNSTITARYTPCYISYSENCACENDN